MFKTFIDKVKSVLSTAWRYIKIDPTSTIFLVIMIIAAAAIMPVHIIGGGMLAMCDLFILRGIIWQGMYVDRIRLLEQNIKDILTK